MQINPLYSDCYFNLGNIYFEEVNDLSKAEICYKSALESLEENKKIEIYKKIEDLPNNNNDQVHEAIEQNRNSIITFGRVCNMIGEISKKKNDYEASIKFYLRGIS